MKKFLKLIYVIFAVSSLSAQQIVDFSHYFYKPMVYNPAFTGHDSVPTIMLINHTQWTGFTGRPQYNVLSFDGTFFNKNTGLGLTVLSDRKGVNSRVGGTVNYSYKLKFNDKASLRLGLAIGVINQSINYSSAITEVQNDPSLFTNSQSKTSYDINAGLSFFYKKLTAGFSMPQLANNSFNYTSSTGQDLAYKQKSQMLTSIKYQFAIDKKEHITLTPLFLARITPNAPFQYNVNVNVQYRDKFWGGLTYKSNYAIGINAGVTLFKKLSIGYSYDLITSSINKQAGLSHEIMLSYKFLKKKNLLEVDPTDGLSGLDRQKQKIQLILEKIEFILDQDKPSEEDIKALNDEISRFFDDDENELAVPPTQETMKKYYKLLKKANDEEQYVLIKGDLIIATKEKDKSKEIDYSDVLITATNAFTQETIGVYSPRQKDGKYFIILSPDNKYNITFEKPGYKTIIKKVTLGKSKKSYEKEQAIRMRKGTP